MLLSSTSGNTRRSMSKARRSGHRLSITTLAVLLLAASQVAPSQALAADDSQSMDSIWVDPAVRSKAAHSAPDAGAPEPTDVTGSPPESAAPSPAAAASKSTPAAPEASSSSASSSASSASSAAPSAASTAQTSLPADTVARASSGDSLDTAAPMCTVSAFKDSPLITGSGWASMGPFKDAGGGFEYVDDKNNRVKLDVSEDHISHAELTIAAYEANRDPLINLLNMQMYIDFFLESLGIKASSIQSINVQLERNRDALLSEMQPLNITGGRYSVVIEKRPATAGNAVDYVVAVNSMDMNKKTVKQPFVSSKPAEESGAADLRVAMLPPRGQQDYIALSHDQLKTQFADLISKWQRIKKQAVRTRQSEQLSSVLTGSALAVQTEAVKYLVSHRCYYDINPKGVSVEQFTEILPGRKYMVAAEVREAAKFIDEASGRVIKDVDDVNRVNYTIEKAGGKWVISNSKLLSASPTRAAARTTAH